MRAQLRFAIVMVLSFLASASAQTATIYTVSSTGTPASTDLNTLYGVRYNIRNSPHPNGVIVKIKAGDYYLSSTFGLDALDSGQAGKLVIYQAEDSLNKPVIHGGRKITTWTPDTSSQISNIWKAAAGDIYTRQIYVNGNKAIRSRSNSSQQLFEMTSGYFTSCPNIDFSTWGNIKDVEVVSNMRWRASRLPVSSVCKNQLMISPLYWQITREANVNLFTRSPALRFENAYELLDQNNEWYLNRTGMLYYKPEVANNSQDVNKLKIIKPETQTLIAGNGVKYVQFANLIFSFTAWNGPTERINNDLNNLNYGFWADQGDHIHKIGPGAAYIIGQIPAALEFTMAENIKIRKCEFRHLGGDGVAFLKGSKNNIICSNIFDDIAATGIYVGDYENVCNTNLNTALTDNLATTEYCHNKLTATGGNELLVTSNIISNNILSNISTEYYSSCGILVSFARNTTITNNTLSAFPYTGISVGWGFSKKVDHGVNYINNNRIDCSGQMMPDGGAIYTLSSQGNNSGGSNSHTQIQGNYIINQKFYRGAIYLDHSSSYMDVTENLIDMNVGHTFASNYECVDDSGSITVVKAIECWYESESVFIGQNKYNQNYVAPTTAGCTGCDNITLGVNTPFASFGTHNSPNTITNSGANINNCN